jgi:hypothetical protein
LLPADSDQNLLSFKVFLRSKGLAGVDMNTGVHAQPGRMNTMRRRVSDFRLANKTLHRIAKFGRKSRNHYRSGGKFA